jgi:hypothetical protein
MAAPISPDVLAAPCFGFVVLLMFMIISFFTAGAFVSPAPVVQEYSQYRD